LDGSEVYQADSFGGNGAGENGYITTGPFASTTLRLRRPNLTASDYHIYRNFSHYFQTAASTISINSCFQVATYTAVWECWAGAPHAAGHGGVGGLMSDVAASAGDPVFFLHVSYPITDVLHDKLKE
jgi:tyrosinase